MHASVWENAQAWIRVRAAMVMSSSMVFAEEYTLFRKEMTAFDKRFILVTLALCTIPGNGDFRECGLPRAHSQGSCGEIASRRLASAYAALGTRHILILGQAPEKVLMAGVAFAVPWTVCKDFIQPVYTGIDKLQ
jgi:hypothetical protein